jgi:hypothetical protein
VTTLKRSSLWQQMKARVGSKDMNQRLDKGASALRQDIKVGDAVVHSVSGRRGIVNAIEFVGGQELVSFNDVSTGIALRRINRHEVRLANAERGSMYRGY